VSILLKGRYSVVYLVKSVSLILVPSGSPILTDCDITALYGRYQRRIEKPRYTASKLYVSTSLIF
jgi:hypothetical protein